jgi:hypothetical protein
MKLKLVYRLLLLLLICTSSFCNKAAFSSKKGTLSAASADGPATVTPVAPSAAQSSSDDLPDLPIYYQGWLKYFKYVGANPNDRPKTFFKNNVFNTQVVKTDKDDVSMCRNV